MWAVKWRIVLAQNRLTVVSNVWYRSAAGDPFLTDVSRLGSYDVGHNSGWQSVFQIPGPAFDSWSNSLTVGIYSASRARSHVSPVSSTQNWIWIKFQFFITLCIFPSRRGISWRVVYWRFSGSEPLLSLCQPCFWIGFTYISTREGWTRLRLCWSQN